MDELLKKVPKEMRPRFTEIVAIIDRFCDQHLNDEYKELCRKMAVVVCHKGSPVVSGKAAGWAAGVVSSVGWVNFLGDPNQKPHLIQEDIAKLIGVSPATMAAKAKIIRDSLDLERMDPRWSRKEILDNNPLVWMVQDKSGIPLDLRQAPRQVQEQAYQQGLIPYIPGEG
jgi:hypothetical protein